MGGYRKKEASSGALSPAGPGALAPTGLGGLPPTGPGVLRPPEMVMRLARLGSFHASRLSFMRQLLRRLGKEAWQFARTEFCLDDKGVGYACYQATRPASSPEESDRSYTLIAFSHDLPADQRTDRVIATQWDVTMTLFDGVPTQEDIQRLSRNVPKQEAGRVSGRELILSRANRSGRLFDHVVERLAAGLQPDPDLLRSTGYLLRTTAVYGSGKFGACDYNQYSIRPEFQSPFQAEMLLVYLTRWFSIDLVNHLASASSQKKGATKGKAVSLSSENRHKLGIGNATGLGMAPYLMNHPGLLNEWISARERAFAKVRNIEHPDRKAVDSLYALARRSMQGLAAWTTDHPVQQQKISTLKQDMPVLLEKIESIQDQAGEYPWQHLWEWSLDALDLEAQELLVSLLIEQYPDLVDDEATRMAFDEEEYQPIDTSGTIGDLLSLVETHYGFSNEQSMKSSHYIWYVSAEKLEPRLGERAGSALDSYELPLGPANDIVRLKDALESWPEQTPLPEFLQENPDLRHVIRRVQACADRPYAEIHDNTLGDDLYPINLLRCKLSFFGATHFDPRSDRWIRINMFKQTPYPDELTMENCDVPVDY